MNTSEIRVNVDRCVRCGLCVTACPFNCITLLDGLPEFKDCRLCGICISKCPVEAISISGKGEAPETDLSQYRGVMVFAEQRDGELRPVVFELIGKGRELADKLGEPLQAVLLGHKVSDCAEELLSFGVDRVYLYNHPILQRFRDDPYSQIIVDLIGEVKPSILLMGATSIGRSLAPRISTMVRTGLTADCTSLDIDGKGNLVQTRPAYGGNIMATIICPRHRPQMATIRPKVMDRAKPVAAPKGVIEERTINDQYILDRTVIIESRKIESGASITDADVIVAGGRGVGGKEGFELLGRLAALLGGAVGASRAAVDEGWVDYAHQVGLSGRTVRPKLYIACGISGSVQHLAGMQTSDVIVAINSDPKAPIFKVATYMVIGDLFEVIPALIDVVKKQGATIRDAVSAAQSVSNP